MPLRKLLPSGAVESGTAAGWVTLPITAVLTVNFIYDKEHGQGVVGNEATPSLSLGAWENTMKRLLNLFIYVAGKWSSDAAWDEQDEGLVFNPRSSLTGPVSYEAGSATRITHDLVINSDGKISHNLWLFCTLIVLFAARAHLVASFGDLMKRVECGPEDIASLTEFKARLINVQRYVERLHDRDSVDGDIEGGGNHGSTSSPPFPHLAPSSLKLDYDTESDEVAQPSATAVQVPPRPAVTPGGMSTSITAGLGSCSPHQDQFGPKAIVGRPLETGPQDPEISTSFSPIPQPSYELSRSPMLSCYPMPGATDASYQEMSSSSMDHEAGYNAQRDRSRSTEGERPPKRVRRRSDSVANRVDRLGRTTPESARPGQNREVLDASDDDDAIQQVALLLARTVVGLCRDRYRPPTLGDEQRGIGMTAVELGELIDVSVLFVVQSVSLVGVFFLSYD
ncbi:hypothetical protein OG21DRAFT_186959 [Imleria badia]|nr:hypothetical protein OG21DRAFT_186959 [Imleria badia]